MNKVRVGIVGSGFGSRVVLPCLSAVPSIQVVAFASRHPSKIRPLMEKYGVPHVVPSLEAMLDRSDIDLVCVATPPTLHAEMMEKILSAKRHVLCEKPLAPTSEETHRIINMAEQSSTLSLVNHQLRYHPNFQKIKSLLDQEALGAVHHVQVSYQTSSRCDPQIPWDWWSDANQGGGELNALGSHFVDTLCWWFGEVKEVQGSLKTYTPTRRDPETNQMRPVTSDEYAACHLSFESGAFASVVLSSVSPGEPSLQIRIVGAQGALVLHGFERLLLMNGKMEGDDISEPDPLVSQPVIGLNPWRTSLVRLGEDLASSILKKTPPRGATLHDGYKTQKILDAIRKSHMVYL